MRRLHSFLARIVPPPRCDWIRAHAAEYDRVEGRSNRVRWAFGLVPLTGFALASQLRREPRSFVGGVLTRTIVATLSAIGLIAGFGLAVLSFNDSEARWVVLLLATALLVQSTFPLVFKLVRSDTARRLVLVGSTLALVVGLAAFGAGLVSNIEPVNDDPEYGPMTIALLIASHGLASLLAFTGRRRAQDLN